jgi:hypothetical protein
MVRSGIVGLTLVIFCQKEAHVEPHDIKSESLAFGQTVKIGDLKISFDKVVFDGRCPADVDCDWPGAFIAELTIARSKRKIQTIRAAMVVTDYMTVEKGDYHAVKANIRSGKYKRAPLEIFDHTFQILRVDPPSAAQGTTIPENAYTLTVQVASQTRQAE